MVAAQVLEATHAVDVKVGRVEDKVLDKVASVDDKVAVVIDGAQSFLISQQDSIFNSDVPSGKRNKGSHTKSRR